MTDESYRLNLVPTTMSPALRADCVLSSIPTVTRRLGARPTVVVVDLALAIDEPKLRAGGLTVRRISRKSAERWHVDLIVDETEQTPAAPPASTAPAAVEEEAKRAVVLQEAGPFEQLSMTPFDVLLNELGK